MKLRFNLTLLLALILLLVSPALAQNTRRPSTPEERQTAVKAAHLLESDPLNKDAKNSSTN